MTSSAPNLRPRWYEGLAGRLIGVLGQILLTLLSVVATILFAPLLPVFDHVFSRWHYVEPTCADPQGLRMLDLREEGVATVKVSSMRDEVFQGVIDSFDGSPGSGWVPERTADEEGEDWISLNFTSPQQIALVCVINGNATDSISYMRADRVRTVDVSLGNGQQELTERTTLRTLPEHEIQNRQDLELPTPASILDKYPPYDRLKLTLSDRYTGIAIDDPNMGPGLDAPTHHVMLAEVEVWIHTEQ